MHTRAFFNHLTFLILFAIVLFTIGTSLHRMCGFISNLEQKPTPTPATESAATLAQL